MNRSIRVAILALAVLVGIAATGAVLAQSSSATYTVPRQSVDGGARRASSASYSFAGTISQPDAGPAMSGATFSVRGGFLRAAAAGPPSDPIIASGFEP